MYGAQDCVSTCTSRSPSWLRPRTRDERRDSGADLTPCPPICCVNTNLRTFGCPEDMSRMCPGHIQLRAAWQAHTTAVRMLRTQGFEHGDGGRSSCVVRWWWGGADGIQRASDRRGAGCTGPAEFGRSPQIVSRNKIINIQRIKLYKRFKQYRQY